MNTTPRFTALNRYIALFQATGVEHCWEWPAYKDKQGYGWYRAGSGNYPAHRLVYEALVGPIPADMTLDHQCFNHGCVNPEHLKPATRSENSRRSLKAIATHCRNGHPYSDKRRAGRRFCETCERSRVRAQNYGRPIVKCDLHAGYGKPPKNCMACARVRADWYASHPEYSETEGKVQYAI